VNLTWQQFGEMCERLARDVASSPEVDAIVGIALGGDITGATIASLAHKDYYPLRLARRDDAALHHTRRVIVPPPKELAGKRVLLVDDVSLTGDTFKIAGHELKQVGVVSIATLVLLRTGEAFRPDYTGLVAEGPLRFPWQRKAN
jgi:hypoxanthine phosphoribosyltransferase